MRNSKEYYHAVHNIKIDEVTVTIALAVNKKYKIFYIGLYNRQKQLSSFRADYPPTKNRDSIKVLSNGNLTEE